MYVLCTNRLLIVRNYYVCPKTYEHTLDTWAEGNYWAEIPQKFISLDEFDELVASITSSRENSEH